MIDWTVSYIFITQVEKFNPKITMKISAYIVWLQNIHLVKSKKKNVYIYAEKGNNFIQFFPSLIECHQINVILKWRGGIVRQMEILYFDGYYIGCYAHALCRAAWMSAIRYFSQHIHNYNITFSKMNHKTTWNPLSIWSKKICNKKFSFNINSTPKYKNFPLWTWTFFL